MFCQIYFDMCFWGCFEGAYCILEGVLRVGLGLLAVCCILYLNLEGLIVFFVSFFWLDFDGEMVGRFPEWKSIADFVEISHIDFDSASACLPFVERS